MRIYVGARGGAFNPPSPTGLWRALRRAAVKAKVRLSRMANVGGNTHAARDARGFAAGAAGTVLRIGRGAARVGGMAVERAHRHTAALREPMRERLSALETQLWGLGLHARESVQDFLTSRSRTIPCLCLLTMTVLIFTASYFGVGLEVTLNGQSLGFVETRDEMEALIDEVEATAAEYLGTPYQLNADVSYSFGYIHRDSMLDPDATRDLLLSVVNGVSTQYALTVDGELIGASDSKTALELLRQRLLKGGTDTSEDTKTEFVQDVQIEERMVPNSAIRSIDEMEAALSGNVQDVVTYTVQDGDTVSAIAQQFSLSVSDIEALNPDLNINRIHIGDTLNISAAVPVLSVKQTQKVEYTEPVAYETVTQKTDELYTNQSRIIQKGVNGTAAVTANVVSVNGVEQSREVLSYTVITEPVTQIKEVGTKALPAKAPKGNFINPFAAGRRTSLYGYRRSGFHTGLDLAGPTGSPILAADGGTVTLARWNGGYGYCVIIDHGNGYQTLYGHCSKLLVSVGQKVAQGEQIAKVGNTGNSTGPHCHFEVRINGNDVNPDNYIGKTYY